MNQAFDEKNDMLNLEADFMHFTIERGTDIDTALEMIKQFINIQKEAGYSVVKNRCRLYLNLSSPDKKHVL